MASTETQSATLQLYLGPMASGKSTKLFMWLHRLKCRKKMAILIAPNMTNTEQVSTVCESRNNTLAAATLIRQDKVDTIAEIVTSKAIKFVGVDEAHFFPADELVKVCRQLLDKGVSIRMAMLDLDFRQELWPATKAMMELADKYKKYHGICSTCGDNAPFTARKAGSCSERVLIGNLTSRVNDRQDQPVYMLVCRKCLQDGRRDGKLQ